MKQHGTGPLEAWRGVLPKLVLFDIKLQLGTNCSAAEPALLGLSLAQLLGEPPKQSQWGS